MNLDGTDRTVPMKFRLGESTVFSVTRTLRVVSRSPFDGDDSLLGPDDWPTIPAGLDGVFIRSAPVGEALAKTARASGAIRYVPDQFRRFFVDINAGFEAYEQKFSSKSRSTIRRKIRKFEKLSGGETEWRTYQTPVEVQEYFKLARKVSAKTYQERMLDSGLPESQDFQDRLMVLAEDNRFRGYLLFLEGEAIAYLHCPVENNALIYQYLGYDPEHSKLSPGTVLQWLALESIFAEGAFDVFDFTGGEGEHKRFFSTGEQLCADVFFLRDTASNAWLVRSHALAEGFSAQAVSYLDKLGLKSRVKKLLRRAA
ncbi:MAG: GNAT family N-acetyltransferase [Gammaproteobacteria bacterium]|nr:GNAT family N-acetyltransferase [Gammaproteobacteria bacterium]